MTEGELAYKRYINGDDSALGCVIQSYRGEVTAYAMSIVRDRFAAEDVAADTFCYLIVNKRKYDFTVPLKYYLLMICRSRAMDYFRRNKKYLPLENAERITDEERDLLGKLVKNERKSALYEAIGALPQEMRSAVYLVYFEEMKYEEAAKVMKTSVKKIDNLLYAAKRRLRESMKEYL